MKKVLCLSTLQIYDSRSRVVKFSGNYFSAFSLCEGVCFNMPWRMCEFAKTGAFWSAEGYSGIQVFSNFFVW